MAKKFAMVFGWIFVVLGVLGFFDNPIVGFNALFHADMAHNVVHLLSGAVLLWAAYGAPAKSAMVLKIFAIVYLLVALVGFFTDSGSVLGLFEVNGADNWLHLALAILFFWGSMSRGSSMGQQM
jgi:hypothetical protein